MPRREYRTTFKCAEQGCRETQFYVHETRRDEAEAHRRQIEKPFKCSRHETPARNLRPGNERTTHVLTATRLPSKSRDGEWLPGLFWVPEGGRPGSGFTFGPGFNAYAVDFPEGTRLTVTAQIEMPATQPASLLAAEEGN